MSSKRLGNAYSGEPIKVVAERFSVLASGRANSLRPRLPPASCFHSRSLLGNFGACVALTWGYAHHGRSTRAGSNVLLPRALLPALDHTLPRCVSIKIEFHYHSFQTGVRGTSHLWGVWSSCIRAVSHSSAKEANLPRAYRTKPARERPAPQLCLEGTAGGICCLRGGWM